MRRAIFGFVVLALASACKNPFVKAKRDAGTSTHGTTTEPTTVVLDVPTVDTTTAPVPTTTTNLEPLVVTPTPATASATSTTKPAMPFAPSQAWAGTYTCAQGKTHVTLRITSVVGNTVGAIFDFTVPSGPSGKFQMSGTYDPSTKHLRLEPGAWIVKPDGYATVPVDATVSPDGKSYTGRIDTRGCSDFSVRR